MATEAGLDTLPRSTANSKILQHAVLATWSLLEAQPQTACQLDSVELRVDSSHRRRQLARH
jgi:hypothetical protein